MIASTHLGASLLAVGLVVLPSPGRAAEDTVSLTILHTNDTHGRLLPFRYPVHDQRGGEESGPPANVELGGIARRATLAARIRAEQGAQGIPVWLVDAGDFMDGTVFSAEYRGHADLEAMAAAGYTLGVLGNHELNQSLESLRQLIAGAPFPLLCANLVERTTGRLLIQPSLVREVGPVRVGVIGVVTTRAGEYRAAQEGLRAEDEVLAVRRAVADLRGRADVLILVSHGGKDLDERIAAEVPAIDVIVGGHSHSRLPTGEIIWRGESLRADDVGGAVIVQAHQWGGELGRLDLLFTRHEDGTWGVARYRATLIPVTADIPEDPQVAGVVERYWRPIAKCDSAVVGTASADFVTRGSDRAEYNLVADAMRAALGTEIHLENLGGVRAPLGRGPVTRADLVAMDPFDNTLVTFQVSGRDLLALLVSHHPAVSGLTYRIEGGRVTQAVVSGRPLDPQRVYRASTNSYMAARILGGRSGLQGTDTGKKRLDTLVEYVRGRGTIDPAYDGRRVVEGEGPR